MNNRGQTINTRYLLIEPLGDGVWGEVWRAHDSVLEMDVAIKLYPASAKVYIDNIRQEYKNVLNLSNEYILSPKDFGISEDESQFMVYSLCKSGSIRKMVGCVQEETVWRIIHDVSQGLQEIHRHSIVHKNLKPENILLNDDNRFVISDISQEGLRATLTKESMDRYISSQVYWAPEMRSGLPVTAQSDVWSLGAIAFELMVGSPLNGVAPDLWISKQLDMLSGPLKDAIGKCLAKAPTARPTPEQLCRLSARILSGKEAPEDIHNASSGQNSGVRTPLEDTPSSRKTKQSGNRNKFVSFIVICLVLSSFVAMGFSYGFGFYSYIYCQAHGYDLFGSDTHFLYYNEWFIMGLLCSFKLLGDTMLLRGIRIGTTISTIALVCLLNVFSHVATERYWPEIGVVFFLYFLFLFLLDRKNWRTIQKKENLSKERWIVWFAAGCIVLFVLCEWIIY